MSVSSLIVSPSGAFLTASRKVLLTNWPALSLYTASFYCIYDICSWWVPLSSKYSFCRKVNKYNLAELSEI